MRLRRYRVPAHDISDAMSVASLDVGRHFRACVIRNSRPSYFFRLGPLQMVWKP